MGLTGRNDKGTKKKGAPEKLGLEIWVTVKVDTTETAGNAIAAAALGAKAVEKDQKRTEETAHKVEEKNEESGGGVWVRPARALSRPCPKP